MLELARYPMIRIRALTAPKPMVMSRSVHTRALIMAFLSVVCWTSLLRAVICKVICVAYTCSSVSVTDSVTRACGVTNTNRAVPLGTRLSKIWFLTMTGAQEIWSARV